MIRWFKWFAVVGSFGLLAACGGGDDHDDEETAAPQNIVAVAQGNPQFSILVEAVEAAELVGTLSGPGPFTVFAPTNDAFAALLTELGLTKDELLANKPLLTQVLTYHVLPAKVERAAVPAGLPIETVQGGIFKVEAVGDALVVTDGRNRSANIVATDIQASNGVIHVIDKVILPAERNLAEVASADPQFSLLVEAVGAADPGVLAALTGAGPLTVFAPTNDAFAALLEELGVTKDALFADQALLTRVLRYHVVPGRVLKAQVPIDTAIDTDEGGRFTVGADLAITDARGRRANIVATDVFATNGVIHVIDRVILPAAE